MDHDHRFVSMQHLDGFFKFSSPDTAYAKHSDLPAQEEHGNQSGHAGIKYQSMEKMKCLPSQGKESSEDCTEAKTAF